MRQPNRRAALGKPVSSSIGRVFQDVPEEIDESRTHGVLIGGMASVPNDIWLARAYMARRDFANAYEEVRRIGFGLDSLIERTAATYAETGEADGYRFILGKSALETGRLEEGRAALAQLLATPALSLEASKTGCVVSREDLERNLQRK